MKELEFSIITLDEFARIYGEMNNRVRHKLDLEVFFTGDHAEFGRITLYRPGPDNKAMLLQHGSVGLEKTGSY
ncbi:MAG: hypothetical protein EPN17_14025 [Methylobacter sp.]|nr:MAG: hypothetical protein EPN17_14025 [Methylobacter sp.]